MSGKDYPDWGGFPISNQSYPLKDLAEHAVRLGSPVGYDRGGAVAFLDSFEYGFNKWSYTKDPTADVPVISASYAATGGFSLKLNASTTLLAGVTIRHYHPIIPVSRWGLSMRFSMEAVPGQMYFSVFRYIGTSVVRCGVVLDNALNKLQIVLPGPTYTDIADLPNFYKSPYLFHYLKIVGDFDTFKYVRLNLDGTLYDVAGAAMYSAVTALQEQLMIALQLSSAGAGEKPVYVDDVILTYNDT